MEIRVWVLGCGDELDQSSHSATPYVFVRSSFHWGNYKQSENLIGDWCDLCHVNVTVKLEAKLCMIMDKGA